MEMSETIIEHKEPRKCAILMLHSWTISSLYTFMKNHTQNNSVDSTVGVLPVSRFLTGSIEL